MKKEARNTLPQNKIECFNLHLLRRAGATETLLLALSIPTTGNTQEANLTGISS
jgi:hypothetical protein